MIYELVESMRGGAIVDKLLKMREEFGVVEQIINVKGAHYSITRTALSIPGYVYTPDRRIVMAENYPVGITLDPALITLTEHQSGTTRNRTPFELRNLPTKAHQFNLFLPPLDGVVNNGDGEMMVDAIIPVYGAPRINKDLVTKYLFLEAKHEAGDPKTSNMVDSGEVWLPSELMEVVEKHFPHIKRYDARTFAGKV